MTTRALVTVSPSRSMTSRSTPCVDGCCGPMLTTSRSDWCGSAPRVASHSPPVTVYTRPSVVSREPAYGSDVVVMAGPSSPVGAPRVRRRDRGALVLDRDAAERVVLALRVTVPVVGHEDPGERRVAVEDDAEHVERLALLPVRRRIDAGHRGDVRVLGGDGDLEPDPAAVGHRRQVVDDVQPRALRRRHGAAAVEVVDAGDAGEQLEAQRLVVPERLHQRQQVLAEDEVGDLTAVDEYPQHRRVVGGLADRLDQRVGDLVEVAAVGPVGGVQRDRAPGLDADQAAEAGGVTAAADAEGALAEATAG